MKAFQQLVRFVLPCLVVLWAQTALAVPVQIVPGAYAGNWRLGNGDDYSGVRTLDVAPGSHTLTVGNQGSFTFSVAANGAVTSANPVAATGALGQLIFNTAQVSVNPAGYTGTWAIQGSTGMLQGQQWVTLVPGLTYLLRVGAYGVIFFDVGAGGAVSTQATASATASGNTLTLFSAPVTIDPGLYASGWSLEGAYGAGTGLRTLNLVPGQRYYVSIAGWGGTFINVAANGTVSPESPASATASGSTLTLKNAQVSFHARDYVGSWGVSNVFNSSQLTGSAQLVPGVQYRLYVGGAGGFLFFVDGNGNVSTQATASATSAGGTLVLNTAPVRIAPRDSAQAWSLNAATVSLPVPWTGTHTLKLVPGVSYRLHAGTSQADFNVSTTCAPSPTYLAIGSAGFDLGCTP
ncbi:hypothetical protein [Hyalangium gracile]|uniref:hypothetical protein n=1 Tax=Hyalangium gracile TaxID=394092 RepID=UPI001CD0246D|nr:hypothetical protein [Hyalangium gracile]